MRAEQFEANDQYSQAWEIARYLEQHSESWVSGEELSRQLGVSRTSIWKYIQTLRRHGLIIEGQTRRGYRYIDDRDSLAPYQIERERKTSWLGRFFRYYPTIGSTNQVAKALAQTYPDDGIVVVADEQTAGRGRRGRQWLSPPGKGLWFSAVLRPELPPAEVAGLTLVAAVAAVRAIHRETGVLLQIKWPNDLELNSYKVGGILTEMSGEADRVDYIVLGLGINVNLAQEEFPPEMRHRASSLAVLAGRKIPRRPLFLTLLVELENCYTEFLRGRFPELLAEWRQRSSTLGKKVNVFLPRRKVEGTAIDVDEEGALLVADEAGRVQRFVAGEVTLREFPAPSDRNPSGTP